jgi:hypothetical protein
MTNQPAGPNAGVRPDVAPASRAEPQLRVTAIELFFDLVFAFTLTQLTAVLTEGLTVGLIAMLAAERQRGGATQSSTSSGEE